MKFTGNRLLSAILLVFFAVVAANCGDPVPGKEMSEAKQSISKAESVKAEKYAEKQFNAAHEALIESHRLATDGEMKDAKEKAQEAKTKANEAYNISLPLLAKDTRLEAEMAIRAAEEANAEEFASAEYESSQEMLTEGDKLFEEKTYLAAYHKYEESREKANEARDIAEAEAETMLRTLATIQEKIDEAEEIGAAQYSPDALREAKKWASIAEQNIDSLKLKAAKEALENAETNADMALNNSLSDWSRAKYIEAEGEVSDTEERLNDLLASSRTAEAEKALKNDVEARTALEEAEETMRAAKEALNEADDRYNDSEYRRSYDYSEEAIRLSQILNEQLPETELLLANATNRSTGNTTGGSDSTNGEGWKTYKVRLIPERRDCLWRISEYDYIYDNARLWPRIYRANKGKIKNPDLIYPGQVFDIPPKDGETEK